MCVGVVWGGARVVVGGCAGRWGGGVTCGGGGGGGHSSVNTQPRGSATRMCVCVIEREMAPCHTGWFSVKCVCLMLLTDDVA